MNIYCIVLVLVAPLAGLFIGRLCRSIFAGLSPADRKMSVMVLVMSALPWLPFAFICLSGVVRFAFLGAIALFYFTIIVSARRA
jgi:hypothetical protein